MSNKDDGGSAFPAQPIYQSRMGSEYIAHDQGGISLRDWLAGQALAGIMACDPTFSDGKYEPSMVARSCFELADAMLKARGE